EEAGSAVEGRGGGRKGGMGREIDVMRSQLQRNRVELLSGSARFGDEHTLVVDAGSGSARNITAQHIVIAVGTRPAHPDSVDFDDRTIIDSDGLLSLERIPESLVVVGAGVIGLAAASMP